MVIFFIEYFDYHLLKIKTLYQYLCFRWRKSHPHCWPFPAPVRNKYFKRWGAFQTFGVRPYKIFGGSQISLVIYWSLLTYQTDIQIMKSPLELHHTQSVAMIWPPVLRPSISLDKIYFHRSNQWILNRNWLYHIIL